MNVFKELMLSMPMLASDFDEDGKLTKEGAERVSEWAWEQLSDAERAEWRYKIANAILEQCIAEGYAEIYIGPDGQECIRLLE